MTKRCLVPLRGWLAPLLLLLALAATPVRAELSHVDYYFPTNKIDILNLLPPPPLDGTLEQTDDLAAVCRIYKSAPTNELAIARDEDLHPSIFSFAPVVGPYFCAENLPKTTNFFNRISKEANQILNTGKNHWLRRRPFLADPADLAPEHPAKGYSYPSGHAAFGTLNALILAEIFPQKRDALFNLGLNMGLHRVMLGDHYSTDIYAGRLVGQAIFQELKSSPDFQHDLHEVQAELAAHQSDR